MATTAKSKPNGLTAAAILVQTQPNIKLNARYVVIVKAEPKVLKGGFAALRCVTYSSHDSKGDPKTSKPKRYRTSIVSTQPNARLHLATLKVSCECPAHVFWGGEYALWRKGAAELVYGNGDPPVVRNPKLVPWACKHLTKVLSQIIAKKV